MNAVRNIKNNLIVIMIMCFPALNNAMHEDKKLSIIKNFFPNTQTIETIQRSMDEIENKKLGYDDYSKRTGLIWSDVLVKNAMPAEIVEEYKTTKVTKVSETIVEQTPESILNYLALKLIVCNEILPKMFEAVGALGAHLQETVFAEIFFQRCCASEAMGWHQDPGEDFEPQADYSLVLMLSDKDDPDYGWTGGEFKIRSGLPEDKYDEADVETIIPEYNQAILFNNRINSHATTEVVPKTEKSKRDIIVIPINLTTLPIRKS
jgi:hypothetical protein